jgi:hypothetical protein
MEKYAIFRLFRSGLAGCGAALGADAVVVIGLMRGRVLFQFWSRDDTSDCPDIIDCWVYLSAERLENGSFTITQHELET